jgi:DNA-binding MarR family transcriptional regulator
MPAMRSSAVDVAPAELAARLRVAGWRFARRMRRESAPGITPTVHAALHSIEVHGPMTAGQLAAHEHVQKPTMTRTIASEGRKLLLRARRRTDEFLAKRVRDLGPADRAVLDAAAGILEHLAEGDR